MSELVMIPLDRLVLDEAYQPRADGLSTSHLRLLMESEPETWPPILVAPSDDETFTVMDGFHRVTAAQQLGLAALPCRVQPGAGYLDGVTANISHGLPLSIQDRKDAARQWADEAPGMSYREIGRRVGLSDKTVKRAVETEGAGPSPSRATPDPLDRWLRQTYLLDRPPSVRSVKREIGTYDEVDRADVARFYASIGRALIDAATSYMEGG